MPKLIQKIEGSVIDNIEGEVLYLSTISGVAKDGDYIELNGFIAFLQDLTRVEELTPLIKPNQFGLRNTHNISEITLEIDY